MCIQDQCYGKRVLNVQFGYIYYFLIILTCSVLGLFRLKSELAARHGEIWIEKEKSWENVYFSVGLRRKKRDLEYASG